MGISWQNNSINYLDFLRAVEDNKPSGPEPRESEAAVPVNFAKLSPEEILKSVQRVVAASGPALATVRQTAPSADPPPGIRADREGGLRARPSSGPPPRPWCPTSEEWLGSCAQ